MLFLSLRYQEILSWNYVCFFVNTCELNIKRYHTSITSDNIYYMSKYTSSTKWLSILYVRTFVCKNFCDRIQIFFQTWARQNLFVLNYMTQNILILNYTWTKLHFLLNFTCDKNYTYNTIIRKKLRCSASQSNTNHG